MTSSTNPAGAKPPFDPLARHVDQETGLEYEDIAAKICGRPQDSERNRQIQHYRQLQYTKTAVKAFWQGWDAHVFDESIKGSGGGTLNEFWQRVEAGKRAGEATGCWGPAAFKAVAQGNLNAQFARMLDKTMYDVLSKGTGTFKVAAVAAGSVLSGKRANLVIFDDVSTP